MSYFGILNLDKPLHCTSHDVVAQVRRKLNFKKVGHAGTLDPLASGVLPTCLGQATRLIEYLPSDKRYRAQVTFGHTTLSWDGEGEFLNSQSASFLTQSAVETLLQSFQGTIQQQVPPHAAVHVNGKKLYEYARKGIVVELPIREATIFEAKLVSFDTTDTDHPVATLDIHCASGTYIRSIAQALGQAAGCGAYMSGLVRTAHGRFPLETSTPLQAFLDSDTPAAILLNPADYLPFPNIDLGLEDAQRVLHGMKLDGRELVSDLRNDKIYLLLLNQLPLAIAAGEDTGRLKPLKVFPHTDA